MFFLLELQFFRQKDFFDATGLEIVENFIKGQNALIFTYGVTSSGKELVFGSLTFCCPSLLYCSITKYQLLNN